MARGHRRKLAAILSADAVGFSGQMHRDEAGTHARLRRCREIIEAWDSPLPLHSFGPPKTSAMKLATCSA